jgi:hypothetical protein
MTIQFEELFTHVISDEAAYHLTDFFYNLALIFESQHLGQIMRYQHSLVKENYNQDKPWEASNEEDWSDPPF